VRLPVPPPRRGGSPIIAPVGKITVRLKPDTTGDCATDRLRGATAVKKSRPTAGASTNPRTPEPPNPRTPDLSSSVVRLDGQVAPAAGGDARAFDFRMQISLDDVYFRESAGKSMAEIEIATAEKIASGDFSFRVERASLSRTNTDPAPYAQRWALKPATRTVRVIVRDRFTGRYGTLDIPTGR
jgi:hypothetical protein